MELARAMLAGIGRNPERTAVTVVGENGAVRERLSGGELRERAHSWHGRLAAAGLEAGHRVALSPDRSADLAALHLGALLAGLTVVPLDGALSGPETDALLKASQASLVVRAGLEGLERDAGGPTAAPNSPITGRAAREGGPPALLLYTSGTTGRPKGVPLGHLNLLANINALARAWSWTADDRVLHMLPAHHFHGLVLALYGSLVRGSEVVMLERFDPRLALDTVAAVGVTMVMAVPTMYARMLAAAEPGDDISGLRLALCGSAPLQPSLWQGFKERFGVELVERYGLSETGIVASNDIDWPAPGTVGRPLDGMRVAIATPAGYAEFGSGDAGGGAVPASGDGDAGATSRGPSGEICVAGPSVTEGYDRDPEATAAAIRDGFFHTGDLGRFDPSGRLVIEGRLKELIIVGGANVAPAEVENALAGVEGVKELAAAGQSHYDLGEVVCAYVVARSAAAAEGLKERLAETAAVRLAPYKRPRAYFLVEELPRNAMGKIDRSRLQR